MTIGNLQTSNRTAPPPKERTSLRGVTLLFLAGALAIYAASWIGPLAFYHAFQKRFNDGRLGIAGGVLRTLPVADAAETAPPSRCVVRDGTRFPIPEGTLREFRNSGEVFVAVLAEGNVQYQRLPADFLRTLYDDELTHTGGTPERSTDEIAVLDDIARATPDAFRFNWPAQTRNAYTARILTKLLLWEDQPVRAIRAHNELHGRSVLVEYADGGAKCVTVTAQATLVIRMEPDAPTAWKTSARQWIPLPYGALQDDQPPVPPHDT
jgi:hypothetical protein